MSFLLRMGLDPKSKPPSNEPVKRSSSNEEEYEDSSDDSSDDECFGTKNKKAKLGPGGKTSKSMSASNTSSKSSKSKSSAATSKASAKSSAHVCILDDDDDDDDDDDNDESEITLAAKARAAKMLAEVYSVRAAASPSTPPTPASARKNGKRGRKAKKAAASKKNEVVDLYKNSAEEEEEIRKFQELLAMVKGPSAASLGGTRAVDLSSLDAEDDAPLLPERRHSSKILTAAERASLAAQSSAALINSILGQPSSNNTQSTSNADNIPKIKLKTRLNGKFEWGWIISSTQPFKVTRARFAEAHALSPSDVVKFEFDGDSVADSDTPAGLDMEDGYVLDVRISDTAYDAAVAHFQKNNGKKPAGLISAPTITALGSNTSLTTSASNAPQAPVGSIEIVVLISSAISRTDTEERVTTYIKPQSTLDALHSGLTRANLFKDDVKLTYFIASDGSSPVELHWHSGKAIGQCISPGSQLLVRKAILAPICIIIRHPSNEDDVTIRIQPDKEIGRVLQSTRAALSQPTARFFFRGAEIGNESSVISDLGLVDRSVIEIVF